MAENGRKREKHASFWAFAISLVVTGAFFYYVFTEIPLKRVWEMVKAIHLPSAVSFIILSLLTTYLRAVRYETLLKAAGTSVSIIGLFLVMLVRNVTSDLLPARIGSLMYVVLARYRLGVTIESGLASFSLALLFDVLAIAPLVILAVLVAGGALPISAVNLILAASVIGIISGSLLFLLPHVTRLCSSFDITQVGLSRDAEESWSSFFGRIEQELSLVRAQRVYGYVLFLSVLMRVSKYSSLYFFLHAIVYPLNFSFGELSPAAVFLGLTAAETSASLPISGIFGIGMYESALAFCLSLVGLGEETALITSLIHRWISQIWGWGLGVIALLILLPKAWSPPERSTKMTSLIRDSLIFISVFAVATGISLFLSPNTHASTERIAETAKGERAPFPIIFDSNRTGTFGIYLYTPEGETQTLYDSPAEEMYPDPSPDGKKIAFAKTLSTARYAPSDIWIMNSDGSSPQLLQKNGTFPSFSPDGNTIYFERERTKIMALSVASGELREIFPGSRSHFSRSQVVKPRIGSEGGLVFFTSDLPSPWYAWSFAEGEQTAKKLARACQPLAHQGELLYVEIGERGASSRIKGAPLAAPEEGSFLTDSTQHSYFPSFSRSGRFILYSRSRAHSHIQGPYSLYLLDRESGTEVLLLDTPSTDRWPKELPSPGETYWR